MLIEYYEIKNETELQKKPSHPKSIKLKFTLYYRMLES